jgi:hypothetical protein
MKKYLVLPLVALFLATGCSDDSQPLTQGDPSDPAFTTFQQQFDTVFDMTGQMVEMVFATMDGVTAQQAGGVSPLAAEYQLSLVWNEDTQFWVGNLSFCDEADTVCFTAVDSVQFIGDSGPVQYPDESLSQIRSFIDVTVTGPGIEEAHAYENFVFTLDGTTVVINGSGGHDAAYTGEDGTGGTCDYEAHFTMSGQGVTLDLMAGGCPTSGTIMYNGSLMAGCAGGEEDFNLNATYHVTITFDGDMMTATVTSGDNFWTYTEPCD